jgi:hypothetical protein
MRYIILGLLMVCMMSSCNDFNRKGQLQTIDRLNVSLDSMDHVLLENRIDTLAGIIIASNRLELRIKENYLADTIDLDFAKKMNRFKEIKKAFETESEAEEEEGESEGRREGSMLGASYATINEGIKDERETLKKLYADIDQGNGNRAAYDEYLSFEKRKVNQLSTLLAFYVKEKHRVLNEFYPLYEMLNAYASKLEDESSKKK